MDQIQPKLTGDDAVVETVIRDAAPAFAGLGFAFTGFTLGGSPATQYFPVFHFFNQRTSQRLNISFLAARRGLNGGFNVLIVAPKNRKLDVEDYLKLHNLEPLATPFTYRDPKTDVRLFAMSFLTALGALLAKELRPIVDGKSFEETPVDWMGYR